MEYSQTFTARFLVSVLINANALDWFEGAIFHLLQWNVIQAAEFMWNCTTY